MTALRQGTVTDEYSLPVPGAQIYVYDRANASAFLFSDPAATIPLAQPIVADAYGFYSYYAADAIYREDTWFLGKLRFREICLVGSVDILKGLPGSPTAGSYATRSAIAALTPTGLDSVDLTEAGREGRFIFDASNLSAKVALDPNQGIYIAPASDTTGVHGAWTRKFVGPAALSWFGPGTADDTAIINSAFALSQKVLFGAQTYNATAIIVPAGGQLITAGFATNIKQKAFTPANTRLITLGNGASIIGDLSIEGQLNQAGDTTGEQNHGIFVYCDSTATSDVANVRIGSVFGKNIRGDILLIGIHPTAYGAGYRTANIHAGRITGDNIYRNGVSVVGGKTIRVAAVECTHVGLYDWDVEPDSGSGPATDVKIGYTNGQYIALAGPTAADYLDDIDAGHLELSGGGSAPSSSTPAYPVTRTIGVQVRNVRKWQYSSLKANNYNAQAIAQVYNSGELAAQRFALGFTELTNICLTEATYHAFILGSPGISIVTIAKLIATATLSTHVITMSCHGAEIHNPVLSGPSGTWRGMNDCANSIVYDLAQTNGIGALGSAGVTFYNGSFNGDTFLSFCDDAASYDTAVTASTAPSVGGNGVKLYGGSINGARNTLTYYEGGSALLTIGTGGIVNAFEFVAANFLKGYVYDNGGHQVVGAQQAAIANGVGSAGSTPTGTEFNTNANALNAILAALRSHGIIAT